MKWKSTLVLLTATVGIGAYIALYEIKQPSPQRRERLARQVIGLPAETVSRIAIATPGTTVTLTRHGADWRIDPDGLRADPNLISELLRITTSLIANRILEGTAGQPPDPDAYGLNPSAVRLTLTTEEASTTLRFGETTPVAKRRYLQRDDQPEIYVVPAGLYETITRPVETFRDHALIRVNQVLTDAVSITSETGTLQLAKRDGEWRLTAPLEDRAEAAAVNALLNALGGIRIQRFLETTPEEVAQVELTVTHGEPLVTTTLRFGAPGADDDETLVTAWRSDEPQAYAVNAADRDALIKNPSDLRARVCFDAFASQITKVEVRRDGTAWMIEWGEQQWRIAESQDALFAPRVEIFVNDLIALRASGFPEGSPSDLEPFGLVEPDGVIEVWTDEAAEPQRLLVGSTLPDSTDRYGLIEARQALIVLPESVTELLTTPVDDLRPTKIVPAVAPSPQTPDGSAPGSALPESAHHYGLIEA